MRPSTKPSKLTKLYKDYPLKKSTHWVPEVPGVPIVDSAEAGADGSAGADDGSGEADDGSAEAGADSADVGAAAGVVPGFKLLGIWLK